MRNFIIFIFILAADAWNFMRGVMLLETEARLRRLPFGEDKRHFIIILVLTWY